MFAGVNQDSGGLSANKKMLIAAVIVLALAALMYLGYGWFVRSRTPAASQSVSLNQGSANPTAEVDPQPSATPAPSPSKPGGPNAAISTPPANPAHTPSSGQPLAGAGKTTVISISASAGAHDVTPPDEPEIRKPDSKPLRVKSTGIGVKNQRQADESAPQLPAIVASANENNLSGVMSSGSTSVPKLSLTTVKISQGVSEGLIIKRVQPKYPRTALQAHAQGAVQIEATINKEGFVTRPKVLSGEPVLARAALEAVSQWRYKPYYLDGAPVEIQTQITINFRPN
jgi:TonB family protein